MGSPLAETPLQPGNCWEVFLFARFLEFRGLGFIFQVYVFQVDCGSIYGLGCWA